MKTTLNFHRISILLSLIFGLTISLEAQLPKLEFKFANPEIIIENSELCFDLETQADEEGFYMEVMNINIFIDNQTLTFSEFKEPRYELNLQTNGTAELMPPGVGPFFFGFEGDAIWAYDILQSTNSDLVSDKEIATHPNWSYLLKACFFIADTISIETRICPPIVWNQSPEGVSFYNQTVGFQAVVYDSTATFTQVNEITNHANWELFKVNTDLGPCAQLLTSNQELQILHHHEITLSPNPARDNLDIIIHGTKTRFSEFEIFTTNGKSVLKLQKDPNSFNSGLAQSIDVSSLSQGVYFIKFSNKGDFQTKRFVKQ